jgi:hypothetical protein
MLVRLIMLAASMGIPTTPSPMRHAPFPVSPPDSAALVARIRRLETEYFIEWRNNWMATYRAGRYSSPRLGAVHCHWDGSFSTAAIHVIRSRQSRRSMCPIWYDQHSIEADERNGPDFALPIALQARARQRRAPLLALLDSAAAALPGDAFIAGQRVRLYLDQSAPDRAHAAARDCRASKWWCDVLLGFVQYNRGATLAADSTFARAVASMPEAERCSWTDLSLLVAEDDRSRYRDIGCDRWAAVNERFWWLADPLYVEAGNERRVEHYARRVKIELHRALTIDERWDWLPAHGGDAIVEMIVRYGWPSFFGWGGGQEDRSHFGWLAFTDSSVNVSGEYVGPRNHTAPDLKAVLDSGMTGFDDYDLAPERTGREPRFDTNWWPVEHYAREGGALVRLDHQRAFFRRARDAEVVVAVRMPADELIAAGRLPYAASLVFMSGPRDSARVTRRTVRPDGKAQTVFTARAPSSTWVISAELTPADSGHGTVGRARFAATLPQSLVSFPPATIALSDILLFEPPPADERLPSDLERASVKMMPTTTLDIGKKMGVFWEMYGVAPDDSVHVALRIAQNDRVGFFRRLGARVGLADRGDAAVVLRWVEPQPGREGSSSVIAGVPVQSRALTLDLSNLGRGGYLMELSVGRPGQPPVTAVRALRIR